jgi:hypothetical protein
MEVFPEDLAPLVSTKLPRVKPLTSIWFNAGICSEFELFPSALCGSSVALFQRGSQGTAEDRFAIYSPIGILLDSAAKCNSNI